MSKVYRIRLSRQVEKFLASALKTDKKLFTRLLHTIESLKTNPYAGFRLKGKFKGKFKIRAGQFRIIYRVFKEELPIIIVDIDHGRDVYRLFL